MTINFAIVGIGRNYLGSIVPIIVQVKTITDYTLLYNFYAYVLGVYCTQLLTEYSINNLINDYVVFSLSLVR